tara:strand:- start:272 stop:862 length:591 start_codon:yes stop_codon:yes gene_type:complete
MFDLGSKVRRILVGEEQEGYFVTEQNRGEIGDLGNVKTTTRLEQGTLNVRSGRVKRDAVYLLIHTEGHQEVYVDKLGVNPIDDRHLDGTDYYADTDEGKLPLEGLELYFMQGEEMPFEVDGVPLERAVEANPLSSVNSLARQWRNETGVEFNPSPSWLNRLSASIHEAIFIASLTPAIIDYCVDVGIDYARQKVRR